jgi:polysaccharide export outer membrane protein
LIVLSLYTTKAYCDTAAQPVSSTVVNAGDSLLIRVLDHSELNTNAMVTVDGSITFPYIGSVYVKDRTISDIEKEITRRLDEGYVKFPTVYVSLQKSLARKLIIFGETFIRGSIFFEDDMTVIKAIALAGGIRDSGLFGDVKVRRKKDGSSGYVEIDINMDGSAGGKATGDMLLQPDDVLIIGRNNNFFINGEVMRPGEHVLQKDMSVIRALSEAGGIKESGIHGDIKVRRKQKGKHGYKDIYIDLEGSSGGLATGDMLLQPDDILIVERNKNFFINGEVVKPGEYVLQKNMSVIRALSEAGGVKETGLYGDIKVRRKQKREYGYEDISIDLDKSDGEKGTGNMLLKEDDVLIVERSGSYYIYGEVNKTGQYVLQKDMTVFKAITIAGGFTKWGAPNRVTILRVKEGANAVSVIKVRVQDVIKGDTSKDILLKEDDIIVAGSGVL